MFWKCLRYVRSFVPLSIMAFAVLSSPAYSQNEKTPETILIPRLDPINKVPVNQSVFQNLTPENNTNPFLAKTALNEETVFLDSLKVKASKYLVTKALYDILIVSGGKVNNVLMTGSSDQGFQKFSGKKIRNIEVKRLEVFGSDIDKPLLSNPTRMDNILNKTHQNTNEFIIRKNLLFSEGDIVSALTLSDNERILRQLPYIDDSRILVVPVSDDEVNVIVITKDVYSIGASIDYSSIKKGRINLIEKNTLSLGHEFMLEIPYDSDLPDSPGFGIRYIIDNIARTFINLNLFYFDGLGNKTYGFSLNRRLVSSTTKYAGGISNRQLICFESGSETVKYNLQDYWLSRSFLLSQKNVTRLIFGARYSDNNYFNNPFQFPDRLLYPDNYNIYLGSVSFSAQKYHKTNLIYGYGRTEDIPYGGLLNLTMGKEVSESGERIYAGTSLSAGLLLKNVGYFYSSAGFSTFIKDSHTEQGLLLLRTSYFSNLAYLGKYRLRNFVNIDYTRGFDREQDEFLKFVRENGFSGFKNDSVSGRQRLSLGIESVLFSPGQVYGFKFAFFAFADIGYLFGTNEFVHQGVFLSSLGIGIRVRNDNLIFNTFQFRLGFFPNLPDYSKVNYFTVSGEQLLKPDNFDPGPPAFLPYR